MQFSDKEDIHNNNAQEAIIKLKIENFSSITEEIQSPITIIRNLKWRVGVFINNTFQASKEFSSKRGKFLAIYVVCLGEERDYVESKSFSWSCRAKVDVRILSQKRDCKSYTKLAGDKGLYQTGKDGSHILYINDRFISLGNIMIPEKGYLKDDTIKMEFKVVADEPEGVSWLSRDQTNYVSISNDELCLSPLVQIIFFTSQMRKSLFRLPPIGEFTSELQKVFYNLIFSHKSVSLEDLIRCPDFAEIYNRKTSNLFTCLLDTIANKFRGTSAEGIIEKYYQGKMLVKCKHVVCSISHFRTFYDLRLNVSGSKDIYEALEDFIETELNDGDKSGQSVRQASAKNTIFESFPPILHLELMSDQDYRSGENNVRFQFYEHLDLSRYLPKQKLAAHKAEYTLHAVVAKWLKGSHKACCTYIDPLGDGYWYRFENHVVTKCTKEDAIDLNFGGRTEEGSQFFLARRLVYIRDDEQKKILQNVSSADVPAQLVRHLRDIDKLIKIDSPNVKYTCDELGRRYMESLYEYENADISEGSLPNMIKQTLLKTQINFKIQLKVPRVSVMLVGLGGKIGTTFAAAIKANVHKMSFKMEDSLVEANYSGSLTQSLSVDLNGDNRGETHENSNKLMKDIIPMIDPDSFFIDGWDVSSTHLGEAMHQAKVLDIHLQKQLYPLLSQIKPRKAIYDLNFVEGNLRTTADNFLDSCKLTKWQQVLQIMEDINQFKTSLKQNKIVVVFAVANEKPTELVKGVHDTAKNLLNTLRTNAFGCGLISPSTLYAVASILSNCTFINICSNNDFVPGLVDLAKQRNISILGGKSTSAQSKSHSILEALGFVDNRKYSRSSIKDSKSQNLSQSKRFCPNGRTSPIDVKSSPAAQTSMRSSDIEYTKELMLGGKRIIRFEDIYKEPFLIVPSIIDMIVLAELCDRVQFRIRRPSLETQNVHFSEFQKFNIILPYLFPALDNSIIKGHSEPYKHRDCMENFLRALISLPPINNADLYHKLSDCSDLENKNI